MQHHTPLLIFTYGTLRRGEVNDITALKPAPVFIGYGHVYGLLYDTGFCPGLLTCTDGFRVHGELYQISPELIPLLDAIEADCGEFFRQSVSVMHMDGHARSCLIYESSTRKIAGKPLIVCGDWVKHRRHRVRASHANFR